MYFSTPQEKWPAKSWEASLNANMKFGSDSETVSFHFFYFHLLCPFIQSTKSLYLYSDNQIQFFYLESTLWPVKAKSLMYSLALLFQKKKVMLELDVSRFPRFPTSILISFYTLSHEKLNCHTYQLDCSIQVMLNNT